MLPLLVERLIIAKFLRSSQPIAPQPIMKILQSTTFYNKDSPKIFLRGLNLLFFLSLFYKKGTKSSFSSGISYNSSTTSKQKLQFIGTYLLVMALIASYDIIPPIKAASVGYCNSCDTKQKHLINQSKKFFLSFNTASSSY